MRKTMFKRGLSGLLALAMCLSLMMVTALAADPSITVTPSITSGKAGDTFQAVIALADNPGIQSMKLLVDYDTTRLTLDQAAFSDDFSAPTVPGVMAIPNVAVQPAIMNWMIMGINECATSGTFITLNFTIKSDAPAGEAAIKLEYNADDVYNANGDNVTFTKNPATVTVTGGEEEKTAVEGTVSIDNKTPAFGDTLTATANVTSATPGTLSYQWYRGETPISGATATTYTTVAEDVGQKVRVEVSAENYSGTLSDETAAVTKAAAPAAPAAPTLEPTDTTIKVTNAVVGQEYAVATTDTAPADGWAKASESPYTFTGLNPNTPYYVFTRTPETDTAMGSDPVSATTTTLKAAQTITAPATYDLVVNGEIDLATLCSSNATGATLTYAIDGGTSTSATLSGSVLTATAVPGTVTVNVDSAAVGEYDAAAQKQIVVTVADKSDVSADITFADGTAPYTAAEQTYEKATVSGTGIDTTAHPVTYTYVADTGKLGTTGKPLTAGTYTVTAKYEDTTHVGSKTATFTITPKAISGVTVSDIPDQPYTGSQIKPAVTAKDGDYTLVEGTDYTLSYGANTQVGATGNTVTLTGMGNYGDKVTKTFTITAKTINFTVDPIASQVYTGKQIKPDVVVKDGTTTLKVGTDYTLTYGDNVNAGTGAGTVKVTGVGNYAGSTGTASFDITKAVYAGNTAVSAMTTEKKGGTMVYDLAALNLGTVTLGTPTYQNNADAVLTGTPSVSGTKLTYTTGSTAAVGTTGDVVVPVTSNNYQDFNVTVTVKTIKETIPTGTPTISGTMSYGQPLSTLKLSVNMMDGTKAVPGAIVWDAPTSTPAAGTTNQTWTFTPTDTATYATVKGSSPVTVAKAAPSGTPVYQTITSSGKTLAAAALNAPSGGFKNPNTNAVVPGTLAWDKPLTTVVTANTAYTWTFTPADTANYSTRTGSFTPYTTSSGGGGGGGSTTITSYTLTFNTNGGSAINSVTKTSGSVVALSTYTPTRTGYTFDGWFSDTDLTKAVTSVTLTKNTTVYAKWTQDGGATGSLPFTDVKDTDWFYDDVKAVVDKGLMNGTSSTTFAPQAATQRGMIVTILYRMEGSPDVTDAAAFPDVSASSNYAKGIIWATKNGIAQGYDDGKFRPNQSVNRQELAAFLYRYAQYKKLDTSAAAPLVSYSDASSISSFATDAVQWAVGAGIINGTSATTISPRGTATRAQLAAMMNRMVTKYAL